MDSNSNMELEGGLFLLDGDDFVTESSDGDVLDIPVLSMYAFLAKTIWKVFVH